jgi:two-component system C4-dicarboxylate transport sensor histidine kinase DctB
MQYRRLRGGASEPRVLVASYVEKDGVVVTITDNGPGVPQTQRNKVFDAFFTTKLDGSGLGLGLAISQSIVTRLGGSLCCDPEYDDGARFTLTLPQTIRRDA